MRERLGRSVDDLGDRIPFGEGTRLLRTFAGLPGTMTHASVSDWAWPATFAELAAINHAEWYMNVHRDRKVEPNPIILPRPWSDRDTAESVSADERARLRTILVASSPFAHD